MPHPPEKALSANGGHAEYWYFFFGAVINLALFLFISIPMEEKHMLEYKPALKTYIDARSMLLILPKKKTKNLSD